MKSTPAQAAQTTLQMAGAMRSLSDWATFEGHEHILDSLNTRGKLMPATRDEQAAYLLAFEWRAATDDYMPQPDVSSTASRSMWW